MERIPESLHSPFLMFRHPVLENILCFFSGFVVVITMGTGWESSTIWRWASYLFAASYNHAGASRETTREQDGILLPFFYLTYYLRYFWSFFRYFSSDETHILPTDRDRSGERTVGTKWRTHDPIFASLINCFGLTKIFSPPPDHPPQQVWPVTFSSVQHLPPVRVIFLDAYYVLDVDIMPTEKENQ